MNMKRALVLVLLVFAGCASTKTISQGSAPPVNIVIVVQPPLQQGDADLFRAMTEEYLHRYVQDGKPLTLSISLDRFEPPAWGRDASWNGVPTDAPVTSGHAVPLVGGMTYAEVGFVPIVGQGGQHGSSTTISPGGYLIATYTIADASGKVLESRRFPVLPLVYYFSPGPHTDTRFAALHDTASYVAKRVASVH